MEYSLQLTINHIFMGNIAVPAKIKPSGGDIFEKLLRLKKM